MSSAGLAVAVGATLAVPAAAAPLDLEEALARARAANPTLRAAAAQVEAARGRRVQAGLVAANPVVSGELARHSGPGEDTQLDRGVALAQEVEVGGQRGLRVTAANHEIAHAEQVLADRDRTVTAEVRRAYYGLGASERQRTLAAESVAIVGRLAAVARRRAAAGDVGALDVHLAEIEEVRAAQALDTADAERSAAAARLASAIGAEPEDPLVIADADIEPPAPPSEVALVSHALATRPDLIAARAERQRLESEASLARRRGLVPNPVLRGFYRQEFFDERIAGGEISIPLPVFNREQGTETALRADAVAAGAEVDRLTREIPRQVHLALVRRAAAAAAWARYEHEGLPAATTARDLIERAYAGGYLGLPEVLTQGERLLATRAGAIRAWLDLREAEADLIEAAGGTLP